MLKRTSKVDSLKITSALLSSVIQIGDANLIHGFTRVLAIQRQAELFFDHEGNYNVYEIFSRPLPAVPISESLTIQSKSLNPIIKVGCIEVIGLSAGAVVHIGNSEHVQMEARTLHIRQLQTVDNTTDKED